MEKSGQEESGSVASCSYACDIFIANTVSQIKEPLVCVLMNANEDLQILCGAIADNATIIDSQMIK